MAEIIIHVGYGKTGTSAIRHALSEASASLAVRGICFRGRTLLREDRFVEGFDSLADYRQAAEREPRGRFLSTTLAVLEEAAREFETVVWSDEGLAHESKLVAPIIDSLSKNHRITVVLYLRNHVDWIVSAYLQWGIRHKTQPGRILSFEDFVDSSEAFLDYESVIERWQNTVGDQALILRSYDQSGDVAADFLSIVGAPEAIDGINMTSRSNETPGYSVASLYKILNDQFEEGILPDKLARALRRAGVPIRDIHPVDPVPLDIDEEELARLSTRFAEQRERLKARFSLELSDKPKPNRFGKREWSTEENTDLIAILGLIAIDLSDRLFRLEKKFRRSGLFDSTSPED